MANTVSSVITRACNFASKWMGGTEDTSYSLNTDYNPVGMNAQDLTAHIGAWQSGAVSKQTLYENLQKGEIASVERTFEEEEGLIETGQDFNPDESDE